MSTGLARRSVGTSVEALGNPVRLLVTEGQASEQGQANALIEKVNAGAAVAVIPGRKNRVTERDYDKTIYKERHQAERLFQKLKHYRRIATRYERLARNYLAMLFLGAIIICLAYMRTSP